MNKVEMFYQVYSYDRSKNDEIIMRFDRAKNARDHYDSIPLSQVDTKELQQVIILRKEGE